MGVTPRLAHVVLQTNQLEAMRDWYCTVLDAHVVHENGTLCFITFDDEHHRLAFARFPGLVDRTRKTVGLAHTAYTYPDLDSLLGRYEQLKAIGIMPSRPIQHGVTTSLYFTDPDGQSVELQIDNFASTRDANAYMLTKEFEADPVGPTFDPQRMLDELRAGTAAADLTTRKWALSSV